MTATGKGIPSNQTTGNFAEGTERQVRLCCGCSACFWLYLEDSAFGCCALIGFSVGSAACCKGD